ncbi:unnamed protein product [Kuraishia capsulata CBS 1993]|uniref:BED-type domain-containing protein n=1 Tax=Kuraishia capsulata CBS 1993 TaxID=1382522 RepID=W6MPW3_9ASCO|nr:uncharacterized protein KUCA_T00004749001 [Kuraishia capsulata CBS 1993]CDK28764.1 unnamed protein product [Kuraishia capsulata CBS 1993]
MYGFIKSAVCFLQYISLVNAAEKRLNLTAGQAIWNCNGGGYADNPALYWTSSLMDSSVHIRAVTPINGRQSCEWNLDVAAISTPDLDVAIIRRSDIEVSGYTRMSQCPYGGTRHDCYDSVFFDKRFDKLITEKLNSSSIELFQLSSESSDTVFTHFVDPTVNYCVIITLNTADKECEVLVDVDWQTSYDRLKEEDFPRTYSNVFCGLVLLVGSAVYYHYVFDKESLATIEYKTDVDWTAQLKSKEIQVRILIHMVAFSCDRLANANELIWAHMLGYPNASFAVELMNHVEGVTAMVEIGWNAYNRFLFSAGYLLIPNSATGWQLSFIRFLTLWHIAFILVFIFGIDADGFGSFFTDKALSMLCLGIQLSVIYMIYRSIKTYFRLRSAAGGDTTRRYLMTLSLFFLETFAREIEPFLLDEDFLHKGNGSLLMSVKGVIVLFVTAYIWKDEVIGPEKSWVWNWFVQDDLDLDVAICDQCGQSIHTLAGEKGSTKMLTEHLGMHQIDEATANPKANVDNSVMENSAQLPQKSNLTQGGYASLPQHILSEFETAPYTGVKFHREVMKFLAENKLPITVARSPTFRQIVFTLRPESILDLDDLDNIYSSFVDVFQMTPAEE